MIEKNLKQKRVVESELETVCRLMSETENCCRKGRFPIKFVRIENDVVILEMYTSDLLNVLSLNVVTR